MKPKACIAFCLCLIASSRVHAQTAVFPAAQTSASIIDRSRIDQTPRIQGGETAAPVKKPASVEAPPMKIAPFVLTRVDVNGSSLPPEGMDEIRHRLIGRTVDAQGVAEIANAVAALYAKSDIALYTIAVPAQDFAGGVLKLEAVEGYIEKIVIHGDVTDRDLSLVCAYAAKVTNIRPLPRAIFERYLSLIRDIPGLTVDAELLQGAHPGATRLVLKLSKKDFAFGASFDSSGTEALGGSEMEGDASLNGLLTEGDQTRLTVAAPVTIKPFQFYQIAHSTPVDSEGTLAQFNLGYLQTHPKGTDLTGTAETASFQLSHPIIRSYHENLYVTGSLDGLNSQNALLGDTISDERTRAIRMGPSYTINDELSDAFASFVVSHGLAALGARTANSALSDPSFNKVNGQAGYDRMLIPDWIMRLRATGQYSRDPLPASELLALGGDQFGRAFETASIVGDSGFAGSGELAWRPPGWLPSYLEGSELYGFVDGGEVFYQHRLNNPEISAPLSSTGAGMRVAVVQKALLQLEAAKALVDVPDQSNGWRLIFSMRVIY